MAKKSKRKTKVKVKKWNIPLTWQVWGLAQVEADTLEEAKKAVFNDPDMKLPPGVYVEDSLVYDEGWAGQSEIERSK